MLNIAPLVCSEYSNIIVIITYVYIWPYCEASIDVLNVVMTLTIIFQKGEYDTCTI